MRIGVIAVGRSGEEARKQVEIAPTDTVEELYRRVAKAFDRNPRTFTLTYNEKPLTDKNQKIATLGMKEGDTVYASIVAEGGGFKETIRRITGSLSSPSFSEDETSPIELSSNQPPYETLSLETSAPILSPSSIRQPEPTQPSLEIRWLNIEYTNMRRHQPAAIARTLRWYLFDFYVPKGRFRGCVFSLHVIVDSPYDPPRIYCYNSHGHPNFYHDGLLCIRTPWTPFGSIWEYLERVKTVIARPNYRSPAR